MKLEPVNTKEYPLIHEFIYRDVEVKMYLDDYGRQEFSRFTVGEDDYEYCAGAYNTCCVDDTKEYIDSILNRPIENKIYKQILNKIEVLREKDSDTNVLNHIVYWLRRITQ